MSRRIMLSDLLGELIVKPLLEGVCYVTGKGIVRALSLGRLYVDLLADPDFPRRRRWYSLTFRRGGRRYLDANVAILIGILVWVAIVFVVVIFWRKVGSWSF